MPDLDTDLHLRMLRGSQKKHPNKIYGMEWANPETSKKLTFVRENFINPYLNTSHNCLEVGPGGGRWSRYLLSFNRVFVVDYHQELLDEFLKNFRAPHVKAIKNNGYDFPLIQDASIDFIFSYGVFVHLEPDLVEKYMPEMFRVMRRGANCVIHYADNTKEAHKKRKGFANNNHIIMNDLIKKHGFTIIEEDKKTNSAANIVVFKK